MKFWVLSDNHDTLMGMRLTGIEGEIISSRDQGLNSLNKVVSREEIGILLVTSEVYKLLRNELDEIRLNKETPLVVEIPDRHNEGSASAITDYIRNAIGVKI